MRLERWASRGMDTIRSINRVMSSTAPNGDIFVSDGHSGQNDNPPPGSTGRVVKFTKDGTYIKEWGKMGSAPGDFRTPHALAFDSRGRLFVADAGTSDSRFSIRTALARYVRAVRPREPSCSSTRTTFCTPSTRSRIRRSTRTGRRVFGSGVRQKTKSRRSSLRTRPGTPTAPLEKAWRWTRTENVYGAEGPNSRETAEGGVTKYLKR